MSWLERLKERWQGKPFIVHDSIGDPKVVAPYISREDDSQYRNYSWDAPNTKGSGGAPRFDDGR